MRKLVSSLAVAAALASLAPVASAANATLVGNGFSVTYDSAITQFGTPSLVGSSLIFSPTLTATAVGNGVDFKTETFSFFVTTNSGYKLSGLSLYETGTSFLAGNSSATAVGVLSATSVGANPQTLSSSFTSVATAAQNPHGTWNGSASLATGGFASSSTSVALTNYLLANATGGVASITKSGAQIGLTVTAVPEPESYAMFLAGLGIIGMMARRRSKAL